MIRCTAPALEEFKKTTYWQDIVDEIDTRIQIRFQELEDPDCNLDIEAIRMIQGGIKAYREIRDNLLDSLIAMASERT